MVFTTSFLRRRWRLIAAAVLCPALLGASEPVKRLFNLPADSAELSIKRLSQQSGVDILLPTSVARDVRTNAVKGEFTVRAALDAMLAGTGLVAAEDKKVGALTVRRESSDPNVQRAAQATARDRPGNFPNALTNLKLVRLP